MGKNMYADWLDFFREQVDDQCNDVRQRNRDVYYQCKAIVAQRMIDKHGLTEAAAKYDAIDARLRSLNDQVKVAERERDIAYAPLVAAIPNMSFWSGSIVDRVGGGYKSQVDEEFEKTPEGAEIVKLKRLRERLPMKLAMASSSKDFAEVIKSIADGLGINLEEYTEE